MSERVGDMSKDELRELMSECVTETLTKMGVDTKDPLTMQRDFQYLRDWRENVDSIKRKGVLTMVSVLLTGLLGLLWLGFKDKLHL